MTVMVKDIKRPTCEYEEQLYGGKSKAANARGQYKFCTNYATKTVIYSSVADYRVKNVCARHVTWAEKELKPYVSDR